MARRRERTPRLTRINPRTAALIALWGAAIVLYSNLVPIQTVLYGTSLPLSFILGAALCGAPLLAISRPRWAIALFSGAAFALPLLVVPELATQAPWPWSVPALLTFVLFVGVVTFVHGARVGVAPLIIGVIVSLAAPLLRPDMVATAATSGSATADLIVTSSIAAAMFLVAALVAGRLRVSAELTKEKEHSALEESRRALVEERTRIARELHDVIAHSMSVIQVQASTARYRIPDIGDAATAELEDIAATARASLTEMRRLLGVLRTEDQSAELAPQQGIDDVPALVDSIRRAGAEVGLVIEGGDAASGANPAVQIATFRIIQEALSNAARHAPGARVEVRLHADADTIRIRVHNAAPPHTSEKHSAGYGLRGMRERSELLGGNLSAGPDADGGWTVEASLPLSDLPLPARTPEKEST
ncbi:sensor histidine kinase [Microbacterium sp. SA39]|uniref:sensor histidine kinase n=1 Tax=Microbacterium sp. SA39 TaxID=1263625 RepID=UPI0005FA3C61|nr:sensor histidine kinase [Microbacterium sp. SA39]KJQ55586.1 Sensor histidine kinase LiaS [Microbacterium sp. SA39]